MITYEISSYKNPNSFSLRFSCDSCFPSFFHIAFLCVVFFGDPAGYLRRYSDDEIKSVTHEHKMLHLFLFIDIFPKYLNMLSSDSCSSSVTQSSVTPMTTWNHFLQDPKMLWQCLFAEILQKHPKICYRVLYSDSCLLSRPFFTGIVCVCFFFRDPER